jgi:ABC-type molybdate transport system substrate-binding protein
MVGIALEAGALSAAERDRSFIVFAAASLTEAVTEVSAAFYHEPRPSRGAGAPNLLKQR